MAFPRRAEHGAGYSNDRPETRPFLYAVAGTLGNAVAHIFTYPFRQRQPEVVYATQTGQRGTSAPTLPAPAEVPVETPVRPVPAEAPAPPVSPTPQKEP